MSDTPPHPELERLVEHTPDVVTVVDGEGHLRYQSPSIERVLGYDPADLVGRPALDYVHPDDRAAAESVLCSDPDDEDPTAEFRFRHADGSWCWLEAVASDAGGSTGGYIVDAGDATDRRSADRERAAVLGRMTDAFYALDEHWEFTFLNDRAENLLGEAREDLIGRDIWSAFPEAADTEVYDRFHRAVDTGETVTFSLYYDPMETHFEVRAYPDESGLTVYFRDVTDQRRTERELERTVATLHSLYELASNADKSFEEKRSEMLELGRSYFDLSYGFVTEISEGTQYIVAATGDHELLQSGESCPLEQSYCRKTIEADEILSVADAREEGWEDDRAFEVFGLGSYVGAKLVVDGDLYGTLCFASSEPRETFSDSERTFVELAARWLSYELERERYRADIEERNERLEEFASIVSHDIRNPLNVAQGALEGVRAECDSPHVADVAESLARMETLIEDILTLARQGEAVGDVEVVDLADLLSECWDTVDSRDATVRVETGLLLEADRSRLQQLLENLLRNAVDHGGDDVTITVGDLADGDGFYVADDGPGIPPEDRETVFDSGYTTDADGTGFGLRIVGKIAAAHGWTVSVTESDAGGARFEVAGVERVD